MSRISYSNANKERERDLQQIVVEMAPAAAIVKRPLEEPQTALGTGVSAASFLIAPGIIKQS